MLPIERKRIEVQLQKVKAAREELELSIMERETDIARMQDNIKIQLEREKVLSEQLSKEGI